MQGIYQHRLRNVFVTIAVVMTMLAATGSLLLLSQMKKGELATKQLAANSQFKNVGTAFSLITGAQQTLASSSAMEEWQKSEDASHFYYNTITLWHELQKDGSPLTSINFDFAVTSTQEEGLVITKNGSTSREHYFDDETKIDEDGRNLIASLCSEKMENPLLFPVYDEKGTLEELYIAQAIGYALPRPVIITRIDVSTIFPKGDISHYAIGSDQEIVAMGTKDDIGLKELPSEMATSSVSFNHGFYSERQRIADTPWYLYVAFPSMLANPIIPTIVLLLLIAMLFFIAFLIMRRTAKNLYKPIEAIIPKSSGKEGIVDEFAILKENGERMKQLSRELEQAMHDNTAMKEKEEEQRLLQGSTENDERTYTVACMELSGDDLSLLPIKIEAETRTDPHVHFIRSTDTLAVLIIDDEGQNAVTVKLRNLLGGSAIQVAISDAIQGKQNIHKAYLQARHILEYRYRHPNCQLFFSSDVALLDENRYTYPLSMEKEFLQSMVLGTAQADIIAEEIREENEGLSGQAYQNLVYAVAATIGRALQELKTSTKELYGEETNWAEIYRKSTEKETLERLFAIAHKIASAIKERGISDDDKLLSLMRSYIGKHYNEDIMLQDLADQFNITAKYCGSLFAKLSNDTFRNYLNQYRISIAQDIIKERPHIKTQELAEMVGFNSATSFIRVFNRYVGMTPQNYADNTQGQNRETP